MKYTICIYSALILLASCKSTEQLTTRPVKIIAETTISSETDLPDSAFIFQPTGLRSEGTAYNSENVITEIATGFHEQDISSSSGIQQIISSSHIIEKETPAAPERTPEQYAQTGFVLGLVSIGMLLTGIGMIWLLTNIFGWFLFMSFASGLLGTISSARALKRIKKEKTKNPYRRKAGWGLGLSIFSVAFIVIYLTAAFIYTMIWWGMI